MRLSAEQAGELLATSTARNKDFDRSPNGVVTAAVNQIKQQYGELLAVLPSEEQWATAVASWVRLNVPTNHAAAVVSDVFTAGFYLETALLTLLDNQTLTPVIVTTESQQDVQNLRKSIAAYRKVLFNEEIEPTPEVIGTRNVEPEPSGPSEGELDAAVIQDWRTIPTSEIRSRCRDAAYKQRFDRLMSAGKLGR